MVAGIYTITNIRNNKIYVGSSNDIYYRMTKHKETLKRNRHYNLYLQSAFNKYGEDSFKFEILEETSLENRLYIEYYWINILYTMNPKYGYNLLPPDIGGNRFTSFKEVDEYDINGIFIRKWSSIKSAASFHNTSISTIVKVCKRKVNYTSNRIFRYHKEELGDVSNNKRGVKIIQYTMDDKIIKIWPSIISAGLDLNVDSSAISRACRGLSKTSVGFKWQYYGS